MDKTSELRSKANFLEIRLAQKRLRDKNHCMETCVNLSMTDLNVRPHSMHLVGILTIINYRKQDVNCLLSSGRMELSLQFTTLYTNNSPISRAIQALTNNPFEYATQRKIFNAILVKA